MLKGRRKQIFAWGLILAIGATIAFFLLRQNEGVDRAKKNQLSEAQNDGKEIAANFAQTTAGTRSSELFPDLPESVLLDVPFISQAPTGKWKDIKQGNGCEEASLLMAIQWVKGEKISAQVAEKEIIAISDFSLNNYGHFHDESNADTLRLLRDYFRHESAYIRENIGREEIRFELARGNAVIVPVNAILLGNPYYQLPFPGNHKLVVVGYDDKTEEFVTNDPGTSRGANYRYPYEKLENALMDYPTGYRASFGTLIKSMIVISKD